MATALPIRRRYPAPLIEEYHALMRQCRQHSLTVVEEERLEEIKAQINTIDRESEEGKKLRAMLEQMDTRLDEIDAQVEAIKKARNGTYPV